MHFNFFRVEIFLNFFLTFPMYFLTFVLTFWKFEIFLKCSEKSIFTVYFTGDHRQIIGSIFQMMRHESSGCLHSKTIENVHTFDTFFERKFLKMIDFHTWYEASVNFYLHTPYLAEALNFVFFSLGSRFYTLKTRVSTSMLRFTPRKCIFLYICI